MAIPFEVYGVGSTTSQKVFKLKFSYPLSSKVTYEAYDNTKAKSAFPSRDSVLSTINDVFSLLGGNKSCIALHDTTAAAPASTGWFPAAVRANTGSVNLLKGVVNYVTQQGATVLANGSILFNMQMKIPATAQTDSSMGYDLLFRYSFTSTTPVLTFYANNKTAGGNNTTADWDAFTPGTHGIVHCRANTPTGGPYYANIPSVPNPAEKTLTALIVSSL